MFQFSRAFLLTVSIVLVVPFLVAGVDTAAPAPSSTCLVCGKLHESQAYPIQYKGRTLHLCSRVCLDEYRTSKSAGQLDTITARIEPRSALFQEDSNPRSPLSAVYLGFGLYVLAGILFGGWASFHAVQKGRSGWPAFGLGLGLNLIGLLIVWARPKQEMAFHSKGLTKIPTTHQEHACPSCGQSNHPSSSRCSRCDTAIEPRVPSEVDLVGLGGKDRS